MVWVQRLLLTVNRIEGKEGSHQRSSPGIRVDQIIELHSGQIPMEKRGRVCPRRRM